MVVVLFNDPTTTEIYTLSLHRALPVSRGGYPGGRRGRRDPRLSPPPAGLPRRDRARVRRPLADEWRHARHPHRQRSEEHTSELQSRQYLVCRLLLEKKQNIIL